MSLKRTSENPIECMKKAIDYGMALTEERIVGDVPILLKPTFISATIEEGEYISINATNGGIYSNEQTPRSLFSISIGVGDRINGMGHSYKAQILPITNALTILEQKLKEGVKKEFYNALSEYFTHHSTISLLKKKPFKRMIQVEPIINIQDTTFPEINIDDLAKIAEEQSKIMGKWPEIEEASVSYNIDKLLKRFISSEGTIIVTKEMSLECFIELTLKDVDGRYLNAYDSFKTTIPKKLPTSKEILRTGEALYKRLMARFDCPVQESGVFPMILDERGSAVLFHEIIAAHLLSAKYILEDNLTTFDFEKLGQKVMPEFISLYDDPKLREAKEWNYYEFDDEGVPTRRRLLVENGILKGYLHDRHTAAVVSEMLHQPVYPGNSRREPNSFDEPEPRIGNLEISTSKPMLFNDMKMELIKICIKEGFPYGMWFFGGAGNVSVEESDEEGGEPGESQHFPRFLYRIYPDGKIIPVKCAHLVGSAYSLLNSITDLGAKREYTKGYCDSSSGSIKTGELSMPALLHSAEFVKEKKDLER